MAILQIDEDYRIRSDPYQWILERSRVASKGAHTGEVVWGRVSYHPNVKQACEKYMEVSLRNSESTNLKELQAVADKCQHYIEMMIEV